MTHRYTRTTMSADVHLGEAESEIRWTDWTQDSANGPYVTVQVAGVCYYVHDLAQCAAIAEAWEEATTALRRAEQQAEQKRLRQAAMPATRRRAKHRITYDRSVDVSDPDQRAECSCGWQGDWWTMRGGQAKVEGERHRDYAEMDETLNS
jgi:hypothetical protein